MPKAEDIIVRTYAPEVQKQWECVKTGYYRSKYMKHHKNIEDWCDELGHKVFKTNPRLPHYCRICIRRRYSDNGSGKVFYVDMKKGWATELIEDLDVLDIETRSGKSIKCFSRRQIAKHSEFFTRDKNPSESCTHQDMQLPMKYNLEMQYILGRFFQSVKKMFVTLMANQIASCSSKEAVDKLCDEFRPCIKKTMNTCISKCKFQRPHCNKKQDMCFNDIAPDLSQYIFEMTNKRYSPSKSLLPTLSNRFCKTVGQETERWFSNVDTSYREFMTKLQATLIMKGETGIKREHRIKFFMDSLSMDLNKPHIDDHASAIRIVLGLPVYAKRKDMQPLDKRLKELEMNHMQDDVTTLFDNVIKKKYCAKKKKKRKCKKMCDPRKRKGMVLMLRNPRGLDLKRILEERMKKHEGMRKEFMKMKQFDQDQKKKRTKRHMVILVVPSDPTKFRPKLHMMMVDEDKLKDREDVINGKKKMETTKKDELELGDLGFEIKDVDDDEEVKGGDDLSLGDLGFEIEGEGKQETNDTVEIQSEPGESNELLNIEEDDNETDTEEETPPVNPGELVVTPSQTIQHKINDKYLVTSLSDFGIQLKSEIAEHQPDDMKFGVVLLQVEK